MLICLHVGIYLPGRGPNERDKKTGGEQHTSIMNATHEHRCYLIKSLLAVPPEMRRATEGISGAVQGCRCMILDKQTICPLCGDIGRARRECI